MSLLFLFQVLTAGEMRVGWARPGCLPDQELGSDEQAFVFDGFKVTWFSFTVQMHSHSINVTCYVLSLAVRLSWLRVEHFSVLNYSGPNVWNNQQQIDVFQDSPQWSCECELEFNLQLIRRSSHLKTKTKHNIQSSKHTISQSKTCWFKLQRDQLHCAGKPFFVFYLLTEYITSRFTITALISYLVRV